MSNNLTLGRGRLLFARNKLVNGVYVPGGERYFGNTPEFSATIESDTLDHYSSDAGIKEKDASVVLQANRTASFTTDNIDPKNVALFFFGENTDFTTAAATISDEAISGVEVGLDYQLGMTTTNPVGVMDLDVYAPEEPGPPVVPAKNVVVMNGASEMVEGTDYAIDMLLGRLTIIGGGIADGDDITVSYKVKAFTRSRVISGTSPVEGALRFISDNPVGDNFVWYMPKVKLSPNGDWALKGDDWQTIPFTVEILKPATGAAIYVDGQPMS